MRLITEYRRCDENYFSGIFSAGALCLKLGYRAITKEEFGRPELDQLMQDAKARKLDAVVVAQFDRFAHFLCQLAAMLSLSIAAATPLSSHPRQSTPTLQQIPGTNLKLKIPSDWRLEKAPGLSIGGYSLKHIGKPESILSLSQSASPRQGHSCASLIGSMQAVFRNDKRTQIIGRPPFVPDRYFGSVLSADPEILLVCLNTGEGMVAVQIQLRSNGSPRPDIVTPMLAAIAESAISQSKVVFSPGRVKLPLLGIEVPVRTGAWGVMTATDGFGTNDVLARSASSRSNELFVTPFFLKDPGTCRSLMANSSMAGRSGATIVRGRRYGSAPWHPDAFEMFPPPFRALEAFVCRDVGQNSRLLVRIEYEKQKITAEDGQIVRQLLDDLGEAADRKFSRK